MPATPTVTRPATQPSNATLTFGRYAVQYLPDGPDDAEPWAILDADGRLWEAHPTRAAAVRAAKAEARAEECERLRDEIGAALDGCEDPATLAAVLAMLGGGE